MAAVAESTLTPHLLYTGVSDEKTQDSGIKVAAFETADTVDTTDAITIALATAGITYLEDIMVFIHTTKDDVIVSSAVEFTSEVTAGSLAITLDDASSNNKHVVVLWGR